VVEGKRRLPATVECGVLVLAAKVDRRRDYMLAGPSEDGEFIVLLQSFGHEIVVDLEEHPTSSPPALTLCGNAWQSRTAA